MKSLSVTLAESLWQNGIDAGVPWAARTFPIRAVALAPLCRMKGLILDKSLKGLDAWKGGHFLPSGGLWIPKTTRRRVG